MFTNLTNFRQLFSSLSGFVNPGDNLPLANNPQNGSAFFANFQAFLADPDIAETIAVDTHPVASVLPKIIGSASDFLKTFSTASSLTVGRDGQHGDLPAGDAKQLLASPEIHLLNDKTATVPNRGNYSRVAAVNAPQLQMGVAENVIGSVRPVKTRKLSAEEEALPLQNTGLPATGTFAFSRTDTGGPSIVAPALPGQLPIDPPTIANGDMELPVQTVSANIVDAETLTPLPSVSPNNQNVATTVAPSNVTNQQPSFAEVTPGTLLQNASVRHPGRGATQAAAISPQFGGAPLNYLAGVGAENQTGVTGQRTQTDVAASLPGLEWRTGLASEAKSTQSGDASPLPVNHVLNDEGATQLTQDVAGKNEAAPSGGSAPLAESRSPKGISFASGLFEAAPVAPEILASARNIRRPVSGNSGQVAEEIPVEPIADVQVKRVDNLADLSGRVNQAVRKVLNGAANAPLNAAPRPEITPSITEASQPKTRLAGNGVQPDNPNSVPGLKRTVNPSSRAVVSSKLVNIVESQIAAPPVASHFSRGEALYATNLRGLRDVRVTPEIVEIPQKISENSVSRVSRAGSALPSRNVATGILPRSRPQTGVVRASGRAAVSRSQGRFFQNNQRVDGKTPAPIHTGLGESISPQGDSLTPARTGQRVTAYRPVKNATPVNNQKTGQIIVNDAKGNAQPTTIEFSTQPFEYIAAGDDSHSDSVSAPPLRKHGDFASPRVAVPAPADQTAAVISSDLPKSAPVSVLNKNRIEGSSENMPQKPPKQPGNILRETEIASSLENIISQNKNEKSVFKGPFFPDRQTSIPVKNSIPRVATTGSHMQEPVLMTENKFPVSNEFAENILLPETAFTEVEPVDQSDILARDVEKITPEKLTQSRSAVSQAHPGNTRVNFSQFAGTQSVPVTTHEHQPRASSGLVPPLAEKVTEPVTVLDVPVFEIKKYDHNSNLATRQVGENVEIFSNHFQSEIPNMLLTSAVAEAAPARPGFRPRPVRETRHSLRSHAEISGETTQVEALKTPVIDHGGDARVAPPLHAAKNVPIDTAVQDSGLQNHASLFTGAQTEALPGENITGSSIHSLVQNGAKTPTITFQTATQFTTQLASMVQEQAYDIFRQPGAMPQQLFIQLEPKEMGVIRLRLRMKKNKLVGKIETGVAETSTLLHQNHSQLLSKLGDMGVQVHDFTIRHNENLAGNQQQFTREHSPRRQANSGKYVEDGDVETLAMPVQNQVMQADHIDVTV